MLQPRHFWQECPDDVLLCVFRNLTFHDTTSIESVCKRWHCFLRSSNYLGTLCLCIEACNAYDNYNYNIARIRCQVDNVEVRSEKPSNAAFSLWRCIRNHRSALRMMLLEIHWNVRAEDSTPFDSLQQQLVTTLQHLITALSCSTSAVLEVYELKLLGNPPGTTLLSCLSQAISHSAATDRALWDVWRICVPLPMAQWSQQELQDIVQIEGCGRQALLDVSLTLLGRRLDKLMLSHLVEQNSRNLSACAPHWNNLRQLRLISANAPAAVVDLSAMQQLTFLEMSNVMLAQVLLPAALERFDYTTGCSVEHQQRSTMQISCCCHDTVWRVAYLDSQTISHQDLHSIPWKALRVHVSHGRGSNVFTVLPRYKRLERLMLDLGDLFATSPMPTLTGLSELTQLSVSSYWLNCADVAAVDRMVCTVVRQLPALQLLEINWFDAPLPLTLAACAAAGITVREQQPSLSLPMNDMQHVVM